MTEQNPLLVDEKENTLRQQISWYEDDFVKIVQQQAYNELWRSPKFNTQAMTFYAKSDEEMFKKVKEWLVGEYTRNLHKPPKRKWWRFWND